MFCSMETVLSKVYEGLLRSIFECRAVAGVTLTKTSHTIIQLQHENIHFCYFWL